MRMVSHLLLQQQDLSSAELARYRLNLSMFL